MRNDQRTLLLGVLYLSLSSLNACQEPSMECLSQFACGAQLTCVSGQCVGPEVEGLSFELYVDEVHARLVSECGVCHAAAPVSEPPPTPEDNIMDGIKGTQLCFHEENNTHRCITKLQIGATCSVSDASLYGRWSF